MGRINITNTKTVTSNANSIISSLTEIKRVQTTIDNILSNLNTYWAENGDEQEFAKILASEQDKLAKIINCSNEFCLAINEYISKIEATSGNVASSN